jgi:hypothetical protein
MRPESSKYVIENYLDELTETCVYEAFKLAKTSYDAEYNLFHEQYNKALTEIQDPNIFDPNKLKPSDVVKAYKKHQSLKKSYILKKRKHDAPWSV